MGYFYGKYLVTKKKRYAFLSLMIPVIYHTVTNALVSLPYISYATVISHGVAAVVAVILILRWQKNKTLDIPVDGASQPRYAPASSAAATPANASAVGGTNSQSTRKEHT